MHAYRFPGARLRPVAHAFCLILGLVLSGCDTTVLSDLDSASRVTPELDLGDFPPVRSPVLEGGSDNDLFESAQPATLPAEGEIVIEGTIGSLDDVDLYALGPALKGDRIIIDVQGHDGLNTVAALFDGSADLIDANNDRSYYAGQVDPYIARVVRSETGTLFLGIAVSRATYFASSSGLYDSGSYGVTVRREPGQATREAEVQTVWLDFAGGQRVQIGLEPFETMRPFSGESMSSRFGGRTARIIELVVENMRRDFASYNVVLFDSLRDARPAERHSTLYFGNFNTSYLGLADNVDTDNAYLEQEAIIYAEDLALYESLQPSVEEAAQALGNIASHELGHLLGLEHTAEAGDLMATASSARGLYEVDSLFARSLLQQAVFPAGWQNGPALLIANVGPNPSGSARLRFADLLPKGGPNFRDKLGLADIPIVMCGQCGPAPQGD